MERKGKVQRHNDDTQLEALRQLIFEAIDSNAVEVVRKDMRLIEAALLADQCVSSTDDRVRNHFRRAAQTVSELTLIVWVNPINPDENCIIWLREGAPPDEQRQLGYSDDMD